MKNKHNKEKHLLSKPDDQQRGSLAGEKPVETAPLLQGTPQGNEDSSQLHQQKLSGDTRLQPGEGAPQSLGQGDAREAK